MSRPGPVRFKTRPTWTLNVPKRIAQYPTIRDYLQYRASFVGLYAAYTLLVWDIGP